MKRRILVASTNQGKLAELSAMLDFDLDWLSLSDFHNIAEVKEDAATFAENARKKATEYAKATGLWTIADDSGLVVDALNGDPGVKSARFSGPKQASENRNLHDHRNMCRVLEFLKGTPAEKRTARFVCCICLASPQGMLAETKGIFEGVIAEEPTGENGFGYDPIFFLPELGKTAAQLTTVQKNAISHRGSAIKKLRPILTRLLSDANSA